MTGHVRKSVDSISINEETEYETLQQEILNSIVARDNWKIAIYIITAAILCVAFEFENALLLLIPYVILFAFQWAIESKNENMIVLSAYISVFLEKGDGWESNSGNIKKAIYAKTAYKKPQGFVSRIIGRVSSVQLGLLCSVSCIICSIVELVAAKDPIVCIKGVCCCVLSIVLYILVRIQTHKVFKLNARKEEYISSLKELKVKHKYTTYTPSENWRFGLMRLPLPSDNYAMSISRCEGYSGHIHDIRIYLFWYGGTLSLRLRRDCFSRDSGQALSKKQLYHYG